jgi:RNA-directed DNA polymerase
LLANLYFRRFLLAWERFDHRKRLDAYVINYADDLVICCRPGNGSAALATMRQLMTRLGLTVNEAKTLLVRLPEERFDFLGYSIGRFHGKDGVPNIGTRRSRKAARRLLQQIHGATTPHKYAGRPELRIAAINRLPRRGQPRIMHDRPGLVAVQIETPSRQFLSCHDLGVPFRVKAGLALRRRRSIRPIPPS